MRAIFAYGMRSTRGVSPSLDSSSSTDSVSCTSSIFATMSAEPSASSRRNCALMLEASDEPLSFAKLSLFGVESMRRRSASIRSRSAAIDDRQQQPEPEMLFGVQPGRVGELVGGESGQQPDKDEEEQSEAPAALRVRNIDETARTGGELRKQFFDEFKDSAHFLFPYS